MTEQEMAHKTEVPGSCPGWPTSDEDWFQVASPCELVFVLLRHLPEGTN